MSVFKNKCGGCGGGVVVVVVVVAVVFSGKTALGTEVHLNLK